MRLGVANLFARSDPAVGSAPAAFGHCVGVRWQRLRGRSERNALETGLGTRIVGDRPAMTEFVADAAWAI